MFTSAGAHNWEGVYTYTSPDKKDKIEVYIGAIESGVYQSYFLDLSAAAVKYKCKVNAITSDKIELSVLRCEKGEASFKSQDIILGLEKNETGIVTNWGAYSPSSGLESGKIAFKLDPSRIDYMFKYNNQMPYEVNFFRDKWITKRLKSLIPNKYDGLLAFLQVEEKMILKNGILVLEGISADKKGIGNSGKNILIVDIRKKVLFLGMIGTDQKQRILSSSEAPEPNILKEWKLRNK